MDRRLEERLQGYIDGRMSAEERARFEESLEHDPDLAALVKADVETGTALRDGEETLSPGFYTRARARFEASARPARRRWFRLLSWETAGLTAAVVLAGVLFVPAMLRDDLRQQSLSSVLETAPEAMAKSGASLADVEADAEDPLEEQVVGSVSDLDDRAKDEAPPPDTAPPTNLKRKRDAPAPAPSESPTQPAPPASEELAENEQYAPAPPALRQQTEKKGARQEMANGASESRREDKSISVFTMELRRFEGIALPAGVVEPGDVRRIETREAWEALRREGGVELDGLGPFDPRWRLVLIGPRTAPFDCEWVTVRESGGAYRIELSPPDDGADRAPHGCGVPLPRDGRGVIVEPFPPVE